MNQLRSIIVLAALCFIVLLSPDVAYATDELDLSVGLKTLPLLINKISGATKLAIIFDPKIPDSKAEADQIKAVIDGGLEAPGGVQLSALLVSTENLSKLNNIKIGIVTKGACTDAVSAAASANSVLTMTSDLDCVRANRCILGVVSRPSVEIYFSKSAADAAKVEFSLSFIMVVKRV